MDRLREDVVRILGYPTTTTKNLIRIDQLLALIQSEVTKSKIEARNKLLNKLTSTYRRVNKPIEASPLELSEEAIQFNRFVDDLYKFIDIERKKKERINELNKAKENV